MRVTGSLRVIIKLRPSGQTGPPEGMAMSLAGVVMAAGEGRRMRSRIPKPLHRICGREMVRYPVELLKDAGADRVVVVVSPENQGRH